MKKNFEGLGLEAIDFQDKSTLKAMLTSSIERLRGAGNADERGKLLAIMSKDILSETGIKVKWEIVDNNLGLAIMVQPLTQTHPIIYKIQQKILAKGGVTGYQILNLEKDLGGKVDLKNSKITGAFSDIENIIYLPRGVWESKTITPGEWAAVLLHELGHAFCYYEFLGITYVTNLLLSEVANVWMGSYPIEKRIEVLTNAEQQLNGTIDDKEAVAKNDDPRVVVAAINARAIEKVRSELKTPWYDQRVFEYLADQFSTRHGAGRDLVTALDKLIRELPWFYRDTAFRSTSSMIVGNLVKFAMEITVNHPFAIISRGSVNLGLITAKSFAQANLFALSMTFLTSLLQDARYRYDNLPDRFETARREILGQLKDKSLNKEYVKQVLEDLEVVDGVIGKLNKLDFIDKMLFEYIADKTLGIRKEIKIQQQYEKLANNSLFERAAQLRTLGN